MKECHGNTSTFPRIAKWASVKEICEAECSIGRESTWNSTNLTSNLNSAISQLCDVGPIIRLLWSLSFVAIAVHSVKQKKITFH